MELDEIRPSEERCDKLLPFNMPFVRLWWESEDRRAAADA